MHRIQHLNSQLTPEVISNLTDEELVSLYSEVQVISRQESYNRFLRYNIRDVDLVRRLDEKRNFIELAMSIAYITKSNYRDALATVKPWTNLIYDMLYKKNVIPDIHRVYQGDIDFMGGYVKEPVAGFYKWVVSFDLNSLDIYGPCSSDVACKLL